MPDAERNGEPWSDEEIGELKMLRKRGYSYSDIARKLGRTRNAISFKLREISDSEREGRIISGQLCWSCVNFASGCSWSRNFIPVKGWTAKRTLVKHGNDSKIESYSVLSCPEYVEG